MMQNFFGTMHIANLLVVAILGMDPRTRAREAAVGVASFRGKT
jgi:hypothetical protein